MLSGRLTRVRITDPPTQCLLGTNRIQFLGHQTEGDMISLSGDNPGKVWKQVQWNEAQERAYSLPKDYLLQEPVLNLPDKIVHSDAFELE